MATVTTKKGKERRKQRLRAESQRERRRDESGATGVVQHAQLVCTALRSHRARSLSLSALSLDTVACFASWLMQLLLLLLLFHALFS